MRIEDRAVTLRIALAAGQLPGIPDHLHEMNSAVRDYGLAYTIAEAQGGSDTLYLER